ncbi:TIGR02453 family protein [Ruegeria marina]|uniref:TIGR02453 family protein n=1 Tax=Ruegeria marina TaxID=639004 RepID=A0A1G6S974_9RHOB|nr:TIGR02453 family protein [Ruegeria marina]SDD13389.1 TIGR02453 family protein [Ruegeria marina]
MSDPLDRLIPEARAFLTELDANNSRDWFTIHKARYHAGLKVPARILLDRMAAHLGTGTATKLFRPQRNVRFSRDKTPYTTHLHLLWTTSDGAQYFFGISPDYVASGGGRMRFDAPSLARYRDRLPRLGPALQAETDALAAQGARLSEPELKRPAPPVKANDPLSDLARRKSLTLWFDHDAGMTDPMAQLVRDFDRLKPFQTALTALLAD